MPDSRKGDTKYATRTNILKGQRLRLDIMRYLAHRYRTAGVASTHREVGISMGRSLPVAGQHLRRLAREGYVKRTDSTLGGYHLTGKYPQPDDFDPEVMEDLDTAALEWELMTGTPRHLLRR